MGFIRTDHTNPDFRALVTLLDRDLAIRDGADHSWFAQFNKIDQIRHCIVGYLENVPVSCGAIKQYDEQTLEVKRMYTVESARRKGYAAGVLNELEKWAVELGYHRLILETGNQQPEAIQLYHRSNFKMIPNYGQYKDVATSVCFEKYI